MEVMNLLFYWPPAYFCLCSVKLLHAC